MILILILGYKLSCLSKEMCEGEIYHVYVFLKQDGYQPIILYGIVNATMPVE